MATGSGRSSLAATFQWLRSVANSEAAGSWRVIALFLLLSTFQTGVQAYWDFNRVPILETLVRAVVIGGAAAAAWLVALLFFAWNRVIQTLSSYALMPIFYWVAVQSNLDPLASTETAFSVGTIRMNSASIALLEIRWFFWLCVCGTAVHESRRTLDLLAQLNAHATEVNRTREEYQQRILNLEIDFHALVDDVLMPRVQALRENIRALAQSPARDALLQNATEVRDFCQNVVRRASHEFYKATQQHLPEPLPPVKLKVFEYAKIDTDRPPLLAGWTFILTYIGLFPVLSTHADRPVVAGYALAYVLISLLAWWLGQRIRLPMSPLSYNLTAALIAVIWLSVLALWLGTFIAAEIGASRADLVRVGELNFTIIIMSILIWMFVGTTGSWRIWNDKSETELFNSRIELRALSVVLHTEELAHRNRLARLLHGSVQGRLAAAAMALTLQSENTQVDKTAAAAELLELAMQDLQTAFVEEHEVERIALDAVTEWQSNWSSILDIEFVDEAEFSQSVTTKQLGGRLLLQLLEEAATNAVRHGGATKMYCRLYRTDAELVIRIENNGHPVDSDEPAGMGIADLQRRGVNIERGLENDLYFLTASWPRNASAALRTAVT